MTHPSEAVVRGFIDCWVARDADGLAALFVDDADFVNVVGLWWRTPRAIRKAHAYGFDRIFQNARLEILELKRRQLRDDVAIIHVLSRLDGQTAPDGGEAGPRTTVLSFVTALEGGAWRIVSAQNTDRIDGADTHLAGSGGTAPASYRRP